MENKIEKYAKDKTVVIGNEILDANVQMKGLHAWDILFLLASQIQKEDDELKYYEIEVSKLQSLLQLKNKNLYANIKDYCKEMIQSYVEYADPVTCKKTGNILREGFKLRTIFRGLDYKEGEGKLLAGINPELKEAFIALDSHFTKFKSILRYMPKLKSQYSKRLYVECARFENTGKLVITVENYRKMMNIPEGKYSQYKDLKKRTINSAIKEINDKTRLYVELEELKAKRKQVGMLIFHIKQNDAVMLAEGQGMLFPDPKDSRLPSEMDDEKRKACEYINRHTKSQEYWEIIRAHPNYEKNSKKVILDFVDNMRIQQEEAQNTQTSPRNQ